MGGDFALLDQLVERRAGDAEMGDPGDTGGSPAPTCRRPAATGRSEESVRARVLARPRSAYQEPFLAESGLIIADFRRGSQCRFRGTPIGRSGSAAGSVVGHGARRGGVGLAWYPAREARASGPGGWECLRRGYRNERSEAKHVGGHAAGQDVHAPGELVGCPEADLAFQAPCDAVAAWRAALRRRRSLPFVVAVCRCRVSLPFVVAVRRCRVSSGLGSHVPLHGAQGEPAAATERRPPNGNGSTRGVLRKGRRPNTTSLLGLPTPNDNGPTRGVLRNGRRPNTTSLLGQATRSPKRRSGAMCWTCATGGIAPRGR